MSGVRSGAQVRCTQDVTVTGQLGARRRLRESLDLDIDLRRYPHGGARSLLAAHPGRHAPSPPCAEAVHPSHVTLRLPHAPSLFDAVRTLHELLASPRCVVTLLQFFIGGMSFWFTEGPKVTINHFFSRGG